MSAGAAEEIREKIQQKITQKIQQCSEYQLYLISKDTTMLEITQGSEYAPWAPVLQRSYD